MASKKTSAKKKAPAKALKVRDLETKVDAKGAAGCPILAALVKDMGY